MTTTPNVRHLASVRVNADQAAAVLYQVLTGVPQSPVALAITAVGFSFVGALSPAEARTIANGLLAAAELVDQRKGAELEPHAGAWAVTPSEVWEQGASERRRMGLCVSCGVPHGQWHLSFCPLNGREHLLLAPPGPASGEDRTLYRCPCGCGGWRRP